MNKSSLAAIMVALAIWANLVAGCGQQPNNNTTTYDGIMAVDPDTTATATDTDDPTTYDGIMETDAFTEGEFFALYRAEVQRRLVSGEDFITDAEARWYKDHGYVVANQQSGLLAGKSLKGDYSYNSYMPVLVRSEGEIYSMSTSQYGSVGIRPDVPFSREGEGTTNGLDELHLTYEEEETLFEDLEVLEKDYEHETVYLPDQGEVQTYKFGQVVVSASARGVYAGRSAWYGFIFRDGSDVFSLDGETLTPIAHGVKSVIEADYKDSSDAWSQPLLLMESGEVKVYIGRSGNEPDSPQNLEDPRYEGGYK